MGLYRGVDAMPSFLLESQKQSFFRYSMGTVKRRLSRARIETSCFSS